jgi:hypothetical protein
MVSAINIILAKDKTSSTCLPRKMIKKKRTEENKTNKTSSFLIIIVNDETSKLIVLPSMHPESYIFSGFCKVESMENFFKQFRI